MRSSTFGLILLFAVTATEADAQDPYSINQPAAAPTQPPPNAFRWTQPAPVQQPLWLHGQQPQLRRQPLRNGLRLFFGIPPKYTMWNVPDYRPYPPRQ